MFDQISLDSRRPTGLSQFIGNAQVLNRLVPQIQKGRIPRLALFHGPSGAGKTTLALILARLFFCTTARQAQWRDTNPCGSCAPCLASPDGIAECHIYTGAQLAENPQQYSQHLRRLLWQNWNLVLVDEAQDLTERLQALMQTDLEQAKAVVLFTTTHPNKLSQILVNRFTNHVYELRRPSQEEAVQGMADLCTRIKVHATPTQLSRVARHYGCDLRKCMEFPHTVVEQTTDGMLTDAFCDMVLGSEVGEESMATVSSPSSPLTTRQPKCI